ncbi:hypothetical protein [Flexivirga caeni]|uniref:LPXTG cell wall anchor domain-containing protein n=1 Tax=Flexivirga caeni TaxID=2294115 RepID=A0A3M9MI36_9MICO|nr:hypothetical protein [Flexivirga caeni]RNI25240.1 hypothetical protein EFY87_00965 [Flexivirga caeni]
MRARFGLLVLPVLLTVLLGGARPATAAPQAGPTAITTTSTTAGLRIGTGTNTDDGTSWATSVPSFQQPTNKTNNEPLLIIAGVVLAILVIGGITALVRLRARGDDADL